MAARNPRRAGLFSFIITTGPLKNLFFAIWRNFAQKKKTLAQIGYRFGGGKKMKSLYIM
jgi:hypothetical protein